MAAVSAQSFLADGFRSAVAPASPPAAVGSAQLRLLMAGGGDERLWLDPVSRRNRYGAPAGPAPDELWFSSSTACAVSPRGWSAAGEALAGLIAPAPSAGVGAWFDGLRARLAAIYGPPGTEAILCASGTEAEFLTLLIGAHLAKGPLVNIVVAPAETGTGVPAAAAGRHFLGRASLGGPVAKGEALPGLGDAPITVETIDIRDADGRLRPTADVDAEAAARVEAAVRAGAFALLHVLDASKTGRPGVSRAAACEILASHPGRVLAVADACQLRCPAAAVRADLEAGLAVMITGSKFAGGPPFSGALLLPPALASHLALWRPQAGPIGAYSASLDWPARLRPALRQRANLGLGLRWTAALAEIEAFEAIPADVRAGLIGAFDAAVRARVAASPALALLDGDEPAGAPGLTPVLHTYPGVDPRAVYQALQAGADPAFPVCHLGQPVAVGPRAALRVCASMPMIARAAEDGLGAVEADLDVLFEAWAAARARL